MICSSLAKKKTLEYRMTLWGLLGTLKNYILKFEEFSELLKPYTVQELVSLNSIIRFRSLEVKRALATVTTLHESKSCPLTERNPLNWL